MSMAIFPVAVALPATRISALVVVDPMDAPSVVAPPVMLRFPPMASCESVAAQYDKPAPAATVTLPVPNPSAVAFLAISLPAVTVVLPVYVFAPERVHVPVPALEMEVALPVEFTIAALTSPAPAVEPCSVRVLLPAPLAVKALVNSSRPVPD